jgi:hypothetical protein
MATRDAGAADDADAACATDSLAQLHAHASKAYELAGKAHFLRAADVYSRAVAAAQALGHEDCLLVARMQISRAEMLASHANLPTLPLEAVGAASREAYESLLPTAMATLQRRRGAGTLLPGALRPHEATFWEEAAPREAALVGLTLAHPAASAQQYGYQLFVQAARLAVFHAIACENAARQMPAVWEDLQLGLLADALELLTQHRTAAGAPPGWHTSEAGLLQVAQRLVTLYRTPGRTGAPAVRECTARFAAAWARVEASGLLRHPQFETLARVQMARRTATAEAAERAATSDARRTCALAGCGAREVHASQFKRCGACQAVCYCSKEHQVEHWPSHKAACKAARKAAAAASGGGDDDAGGAAGR